MKYLSLFSGIGGFELGIQQAYENRNTNVSEVGGRQKIEARELQEIRKGLYSVPSEATLHIGNGDNELPYWSINERQPHCIGFSEIDKYATQIYQSHFPEHKNYGDITKINEKELPDFDLLVGGFPCQSFSIAGKRGGFRDTRGTLFFDIARILKAKQPSLLLLENVKGLLSHDEGRTFTTIISTLDELGYDLQWQVLNSKNFGVPQNRERVFIVGHLRGTSRPKVFPITGKSVEDSKRVGQEVSYCLDANYAKGTNTIKKSRRQVIEVDGYLSNQKWDKFNESSRRVYGTNGISPTIPTATGGGHTPKINIKDIEESLAFAGLEITEKGYEALDKLTKNRIRRLTPKECERLQGFPDNWTEGVSDTQRYKCLGNAVTVNVIKEIVSRITCK